MKTMRSKGNQRAARMDRQYQEDAMKGFRLALIFDPSYH